MFDDYTLTTPPPGGRGCGDRKEGGLYMCTGVRTDGLGTPWYEFLIDPPTPFVGEAFQGVQPAPAELIAPESGQDVVYYMDMVGFTHYPTVPSYVEEIRRFGRSRYVPETFDWSKVAGKRLYVVDIHWRATVAMHGDPPGPELLFRYCQHLDGDADGHHLAECIFNLWPLAIAEHGLIDDNADQRIEAPWGAWNPLNVIEGGYEMDALDVIESYPQVTLGPGAFAVWPVTHIEAVGYVNQDANAHECDLPVVVMEE